MSVMIETVQGDQISAGFLGLEGRDLQFGEHDPVRFVDFCKYSVEVIFKAFPYIGENNQETLRNIYERNIEFLWNGSQILPLPESVPNIEGITAEDLFDFSDGVVVIGKSTETPLNIDVIEFVKVTLHCLTGGFTGRLDESTVQAASIAFAQLRALFVVQD
jgi:hypothetical protein